MLLAPHVFGLRRSSLKVQEQRSVWAARGALVEGEPHTDTMLTSLRVPTLSYPL